MSHFTVLVVGENVKEQLAPYHEFECTGEVDEHVQSISLLEELQNGYKSANVRKIRDADGVLHDPWSDKFYRDPTPEELEKHSPMMGSGFGGDLSWSSRDWNDGLGYRAKVSYVPEGCEEVTLAAADTQTFLEYCQDEYELPAVKKGTEIDLEEEHKWGWILLDENGEVEDVIKRTNPNAKWDWYQVGGRWAGFWKLKPGRSGKKGDRSLLMGGGEAPGDDVADSALKGDIDLDRMRAEAEGKAALLYDAAIGVIADVSPALKSWDEIRQKYLGHDGLPASEQGGIDAARKEYNAQPALIALRELPGEHGRFFQWNSPNDIYRYDRETYIKLEGIKSVMTFAVVKDGQWYERGSMGWWGCVSDEKDEQEWILEFGNLVSGLSDDTRLTVVDCHI